MVARVATTLTLRVRELRRPSGKARSDWTYCPTRTAYGLSRYVGGSSESNMKGRCSVSCKKNICTLFSSEYGSLALCDPKTVSKWKMKCTIWAKKTKLICVFLCLLSVSRWCFSVSTPCSVCHTRQQLGVRKCCTMQLRIL